MRPVLPRVGARLDGRGWVVKGNVGLYTRPPDVLELYGDRGPLVGNPALQPERSESWEVSVEQLVNDTWTIKLGYFDAAYRDLIDFARNRA